MQAEYCIQDCVPPPVDGIAAVGAYLPHVLAIAVMPDGGFVFSDDESGVVRRVSSKGILSTLAGSMPSTSTNRAPVGIGGAATRAVLGWPSTVAASPDGRVYVDASGWIVRVDPDRILRLVAHQRGWSGDMPLTVQPDGGLLVRDQRGIERVAPDGRVSVFAALAFPSTGLVALPDGSALTINTDSRAILRIEPGGRRTVVIPGRAFDDFAGREPVLGDPTLLV